MSQEYTPVSWQDETTSQQGTLINAERLNQMQTAHHYADGFEEVDEIPTEDPGTAYHKIVYCTEDSAFYRWDGTQWTADIDEETKQLLDQEIARATAAEGELAQDIEDEATARAQADTALGERITAETGAREGADTALGARIDAEAEYRADVDRQIYADIGRLNGETIPLRTGSSTPTIQNAIAANEGNISNLTSVVDGLSYDLGQEVTDRENADTQLAADITAEVQARAAAIASLQAGVYTKTEADNLLAGKADKATTLAGYGITDAVTLGTAQTIPGAKTLTSAPTILANNEFAHIDIKSTRTSGNLGGILFKDGAGTTINSIYSQAGGLMGITLDGTTKALILTGQRAYNPSHTTDVATIDTLDGYTPMVRTTGAQNITGLKTFRNGQIGGMTIWSHTSLNIESTVSEAQNVPWLIVTDTNQNELAGLMIQRRTDNGITLYARIRNADGTIKFVAIAAGDR